MKKKSRTKQISQDEVLASLAAAGKVRLPIRTGGIRNFETFKIKGMPLSETVIEERR